jgi:hypothetical protein
VNLVYYSRKSSTGATNRRGTPASPPASSLEPQASERAKPALGKGCLRSVLADRLGFLLLALAVVSALGLGGTGCGPNDGLPDGILPTLVSYEPTHATSGTGTTTGTAASVSISAFEFSTSTVRRGDSFTTTISVANTSSSTYSAVTTLAFTRSSAPTEVSTQYSATPATAQAVSGSATTKLIKSVAVNAVATTGTVTVGGTVTLTRTGETKQLKLTSKSITVTF